MAGVHIKHVSKARYMAVKEDANWPCAFMDNKWNKFTVCDNDGEPNAKGDLDDGQYCKIKTHYTMHTNYEWCYMTDAGWIYFDKFSNNEKQLWKVHKSGSQVCFESAEWPGYYLGTKDEWLGSEQTKTWWLIEWITDDEKMNLKSEDSLFKIYTA